MQLREGDHCEMSGWEKNGDWVILAFSQFSWQSKVESRGTFVACFYVLASCTACKWVSLQFSECMKVSTSVLPTKTHRYIFATASSTPPARVGPRLTATPSDPPGRSLVRRFVPVAHAFVNASVDKFFGVLIKWDSPETVPKDVLSPLEARVI